MDARLEGLAERGTAVGDLPQHRENGAGHVLSRTLRRRRGLAAATAEPDAARQLAGQELHFLPRSLRASGVVEALGLRELLPQLLEPASVGLTGVRIEKLARIAEIGRAETGPCRRARVLARLTSAEVEHVE